MESSGAGINKNAPKKKRFFVFWELYFRKFWKMVALSLLYFLFCIPVITVGPATAALVKILKNYSIEKNAFLFSDFWDAFRSNFLQAFPVGLLDLVFGFCVAVALEWYPKMAAENSLYYVMLGLTLSVTLTVTIMNFYAFLMISVTNIKLGKILKNSFFLTAVAIKKNLLTFFIVLGVIIVQVLLCILNLAFILMVPLVTLSFVWFIIVFNSYPVIQKYVINPYYEEHNEVNPESDTALSSEEPIFVDKGGSEAPVKAIKSKGKGKKTIS